MKRNIFGAIVAVLLTALIVTSGMFIPRLTLKAQREELLSRSGAVEAKSLTPYGNSSRSLTQHISALAQLVDSAILGNGKAAILVDDRAPLDTELSAHDAELAADKFFQCLSATSDTYGLTLSSVSDTSSYASTGEAESFSPEYDMESPVPSPDAAGASLLTSADDSALSMWLIVSDNSTILIDALSGIPVYCSLLDEAFVKAAFSDVTVFWEISASTYNLLYPNQMVFPQLAQDKFSSDKGGLTIWSGDSPEGFTMEVSVNTELADGMEIKISA